MVSGSMRAGRTCAAGTAPLSARRHRTRRLVLDKGLFLGKRDVAIRRFDPKPTIAESLGISEAAACKKPILQGCAPEAGDLDVLGRLGAKVSVRRLHRLEDARDLVGLLVDLRRPLPAVSTAIWSLTNLQVHGQYAQKGPVEEIVAARRPRDAERRPP